MHVWFRSYFMTQEADPQGRRVFPVASHHLVVLGQTLPCLITGRGKQSDARVGPCGAVILSLILSSPLLLLLDRVVQLRLNMLGARRVACCRSGGQLGVDDGQEAE